MSILKKLLSYILLKRDKEFADNKYLKMMHGINKISIFIFLIAVVYLIIRFFI